MLGVACGDVDDDDSGDGLSEGDSEGDGDGDGDGEMDACDTPAGGTVKCADDGGGEGDTVSFNDDIQPIFTDNCLTGTYNDAPANCHQPGSVDEEFFDVELDLREGMAYESLCGTGVACERTATKSTGLLVEPNAPCSSFLWRKMDGCTLDAIDGEGVSMPYLVDRGTQDDIDMIWAWIEQGAAPPL